MNCMFIILQFPNNINIQPNFTAIWRKKKKNKTKLTKTTKASTHRNSKIYCGGKRKYPCNYPCRTNIYWCSTKNSQKRGLINKGIKDTSKRRYGISRVPWAEGINERKWWLLSPERMPWLIPKWKSNAAPLFASELSFFFLVCLDQESKGVLI